jgi:hypothetical protein
MMTGERPAKYRQEIQQASDFGIPVLPMLMRLVHQIQQMMFVGGETAEPSIETTAVPSIACEASRQMHISRTNGQLHETYTKFT